MTPVWIIGAAIALLFYTYFGYPALLWIASRIRTHPVPSPADRVTWPSVSISVPAYNEEDQIEELIRSLLALDYPRDRLQVLIVSDGSTDRTDEIVRSYADDGIELLRVEPRGGKTKAEHAASQHLRGEIIVNTDASIRIEPGALKPLIAAFEDPTIGCASGRDQSVASQEQTANAGESSYVGYEMSVRDLETRVSGIVGSSGCFYAIRADLHRLPLPEGLSRDFASALHTKEHGYRAVSVSDAVCLVPRAPSLRKEYRRKVRTITRGMQTLWFKRRLMNPARTGLFAWMLFSHKVCRWALPWGAMAAAAALVWLAATEPLARPLVGFGGLILGLAWIGWRRADEPSVSKLFSVPAFLVAGNLAAAHALVRAVAGANDALWEPTRRDVVKSA